MTEDEWRACDDPDRMIAALSDRLEPRRRLLFEATCCDRLLPWVADDRVARTLGLVQSFVSGSQSSDAILAVTDLIRRAVEDAFCEAMDAEADADFSDHPAYSAARAGAATAYAAGALFEWVAGDLVLPAAVAGANSPPHRLAADAAGHRAAAAALVAWASVDITGRQRSPRYKVAETTFRIGRWAEERIQAHLLRCVAGNTFAPDLFDPRWLTPTVLAITEGIYADRAFDRLPVLGDALEDVGCENADLLAHCRSDGPHARGCWAVDLVLGKR